MSFDLDVCYREGFPIVRVLGDVDIYTAPLLDACLQRLVSAGHGELAVDLENCSYFDSEGIKALVKALHCLGEKGRLYICGARGAVLRVIEVSGLEALFPILSSIDALPTD